MTCITDSARNLLSNVRITIGKCNQLEFYEDALNEANFITLIERCVKNMGAVSSIKTVTENFTVM